jgi:DNA-binding response OmpR family regulator
MAGTTRSVLVVGVGAERFANLAPILKRARMFAELVATGARALELAAVLPYDAVAVTVPLDDTPLEEWLGRLRDQAIASRKAAVLLLVDSGHENDARALLERGANRIVGADEPPERVQALVSALLGVAPRVSLRAASRLQVQLERGTTQVLCQTENISATGMLIRTDQQYPVGTLLSFELSLPGASKPIHGSARVVRHTTIRRERVSGVGVAFSGFDRDDGTRFAAHIGRIAV